MVDDSTNRRRGRITKFKEASFRYKEEINNAHLLRNRMKICSLAVCLMWASSLRTAAFISSYAVQVPSLHLVYETCKSSAHILLEEETGFSQCANRQLEQCENELNTAIYIESTRVDELSSRNSDIVFSLREVAMNCTEDGTSLQRSLESWLSVSQEIPTRNDTCSVKDRESMFSTIYDVNSLRSEAVSVFLNYSQESTMVMGNIVEYAKKRFEYDKNYASSYVKDFELEFMNYIGKTPLPSFRVSIDFHSITSEIERLMDCSTLLDIPYLSCDEFFPDIKFGGHWKHQTDAMVEKWLLMSNHWKKSYSQMMLKINDFHSMAKGAETNFLKYWNAATDVWNYEVSGFTKWTMKGVLDWNFVAGDTLGSAYDSVKKAWKSKLPCLNDFPFHDIDLVDNFQGPFLNEYSKLSSKWKGVVDKSYETFKERLDLSLSETLVIVEDMEITVRRARNSLMENVSLIPADYNPPQYIGAKVEINELGEELETYRSTSEAFLVDSEDTINNVANASNKMDTQDSLIFNKTKADTTAIQSDMRDFDVTFERLTAPGITFDIWFLKFSSMSDLLFMIDYVFRVFFTLRMCYKYWRVSEVQIPKVDIRTQKEVTNPFEMSNGRLIISFFTNPMIGAFLGSIISVATAATIMSVYFPLYTEYRNGCVPSEANGTFIGENVYSSAYNFAYREGSSSILRGTDQLDMLKANACGSMNLSSVKKYNEQLAISASQTQIISRIGNQMGILERCIDTDISDQQYIAACCDHEGYSGCNNDVPLTLTCPLDLRQTPAKPYAPPGDYISRRSCDIDTDSIQWRLDEAIFDCSTLPYCDITCPGPHKDRLRRITKECSCLTEWFVHSLCFRWLLSILIFGLMNSSRIIFVNGLAKVIWRRLHPGTFTVWATCDETGAIITQLGSDDKNEEGLHLDNNSNRKSIPANLVRDIKTTIERNSFKFRLGGFAAMFLAALMNLSWFLLVINAPDASKVKWL